MYFLYRCLPTINRTPSVSEKGDDLVTMGITAGALYEIFNPEKAKALRDRFEFVFTPKHGSFGSIWQR